MSDKYEGKAFNPKGVEPDAHERFWAPPAEVMEKWRQFWGKKDPHDNVVTYQDIQEARKRGESGNLGHYAYEMFYDIYAGIEDELLVGAIDSHVHIYPDYVPRSMDIVEYAIEASRAKMRAVVTKDHFFTNVGQCWAAQRIVEDMVRRGELEHACKVLGTHNLAWSHHPDQLNLIRKYPNLGAIFFYTMTGGIQAGPVLKICDDNGELDSEVKECIELAAEYDIPIMTGHKKPHEVLAIVTHCSKVNANVLVTHAGGNSFCCGHEDDFSIGGGGMAGTIEQAKELVKLGAYLELNANKLIPSLIWPIVDPNDPVEFIKQIGHERIIANTDFGQVLVCHPVEGLRIFIRALLHAGISRDAVKTMIQTNPADFLSLEDEPVPVATPTDDGV